jgi:hypothetical protein
MDGFDGFDSSSGHLCGSRSHSNGIALKKKLRYNIGFGELYIRKNYLPVMEVLKTPNKCNTIEKEKKPRYYLCS